MNDTYKVRSVGGSLVVTLPQFAVKQVPLKAGDDVTVITTKDGTIMIRKVQPVNGKRGRK